MLSLKTKQQRTHCSKGFNLIEAAIVLGVVGLVIGGIWIASAAIQNKRQTNQIVQTVGVLHSNIQKLFQRNITSDMSMINFNANMLRTLAPPGTIVKQTGPMFAAIYDEFGNSYMVTGLTTSGLLYLFIQIPIGQCIAAGPRLAVALKPHLSPQSSSDFGIFSVTGGVDTPAHAIANCDANGLTINLNL